MKKSLVALSRAASSLKRTAFRSPSSRGVIPSRSASCATGSPCSSVPGEEEHVLAPLPHVPREHVGGDRRVGVPEMGLAVHVVDRRRHVVRHHPSMLPAGGRRDRARRHAAHAAARGASVTSARGERRRASSPAVADDRPGARESGHAAGADGRSAASVRPRMPAASRRPAHASAQPMSGPSGWLGAVEPSACRAGAIGRARAAPRGAAPARSAAEPRLERRRGPASVPRTACRRWVRAPAPAAATMGAAARRGRAASGWAAARNGDAARVPGAARGAGPARGRPRRAARRRRGAGRGAGRGAPRRRRRRRRAPGRARVPRQRAAASALARRQRRRAAGIDSGSR